MLIQCDRHTKADLALWEELEEADHVHARTIGRLIDESLEAIEAFARLGSCYCAISGGKDSAVLAHLVGRVNPSVPARWLATEPLVDPYCRHAINLIVTHAGLRDFREHTNWCHRDPFGWHATGTLEDGIQSIQAEVGTSRYILGVRANESKVRKLSARCHGKFTATSCRPLLWWTAADVFAYAAIHHVPLHPTYGMMGGGRWPRDRLRVSFLTLRHGENMGREEWEREYYGDVINSLSARTGTDHQSHDRQ